MKVMFVLGTRPEAIKLVPVIKEFAKHKKYKLKVCFTGQHQEMVLPIFEFFDIKIDKNLKLMRNDQTLSAITGRLFTNLGIYLAAQKPDLIFVQGDTNTARVAATVAFYLKIKIAHIEAGLRTFDIMSPFPEEYNRVVISKIANYHFAPTKRAKNNLLAEGIKKDAILVTGNTGIDTLLLTLKKYKTIASDNDWGKNGRNIILITCHRRENFGKRLNEICKAIKELSFIYKNFDFVFPVHLNPNVQKTVNQELQGLNNVFLIKPLNYLEFVSLMDKSYIILTDSGGIQEEAPSLKKPVLILRETTERQEAVESELAILIGDNAENIITYTKKLVEDSNFYSKMTQNKNPYGDGNAAITIFNKLENILS
ncbi:non-hydrolyzing UDP-N-acetylglucosamine 2-epimerase [Pedobacter zeae]|uniref:UDP-N-acetylglucosamine 2-epimerase (non-hydrolyzing) n=1 Tax=Pedobacter zeae TaxID=1737356 RepID=A0A7W6KBI4_9SPHI|nr:UDP-N-acetylglucosamine 2-epimerase (non-hydrolyzing) [Pedobacter zeae]MBB4107806.1 UDP-N-acetylglucosamine 2-epimerase (non-hydrolyzing) [Pedobacter zeae]GGG96925.1 UDP-N-acetyl glucosamine 2-epimerase [Pedobacter zeae]